MSEATCTPGPWRYEKNTDTNEWEFDIIGTEPEGGLTVDEHIIASVFFTAYGTKPIRDGEANARLMAAAPDLLEACEAVLFQLDYLQNLWSKEAITERLTERLRAVVKKANVEA